MEFIPVYRPDISGNELKYVTDCITSGWISSLGEYVSRFEQDFASLCQVKHAISLANGTVALHLALLVMDIGPGDEVLVPPLTFVATANAVRYVGATPVFVDVDPITWTINPNEIEKAITTNTRAMIPVHLYGHPADMDELLQIAEKYDIAIVEDAAEAHGAKVRDRIVGGLGDVGCFSFYGNKAITTGEGGMLTTNDNQLAERARFLKDHGMDKNKYYWHSEVGYNYRMTNLQAAVGVAQIERFADIYSRKRKIGQLYKDKLADIPGIVTQPEAKWAESSYWMISILVNDEFPINRDDLRKILYEKGIDTRPFFYPMHYLPPYHEDKGSYPVSEKLAENGINLPSYPGLTDEDISRICNEIHRITD